MKKILVSFALLISAAAPLVSAPSSPASMVINLKPRQPNWRFEVIQSYPHGSPETILFYEPTVEGGERAVKKIDFYENNRIRAEMDVVLVEEGTPGAQNWQSNLVPHGNRIELDPEGRLVLAESYQFGVLDGECKSFYPDGKIKSQTTYREGKIEGTAASFYENGQIKEEAQLEKGLLNGSVLQYHENGNKAASYFYKQGLVNGTALNWFPEGGLRQQRQFVEGKLHGDGKNPALITYDSERNIVEVLDFKEGQPQGMHIYYHKNGKEAYRVHFKNGKKQGKEQVFNEEGILTGEGSFDADIPFGQHWRKHPNGQLASSAQFDAEGHLKEPICEWDLQGQKTRQFFIRDGKMDGPYFEWYGDGTPKIEYNYSMGEYDGAQKEYFPSGQIKISASYKMNKHDGVHEEWHENGVLARRIHFSDGLKEGQMGEWYANGNSKLDAYFLADKPDGVQSEWHENGQIKTRAEFLSGMKQGWQREWAESGDPVVESYFDQDLLHGTVFAWWSKDQIKTRLQYERGKKEGKHEWFHKNGKPERKAFYKNGELDGETIVWFPDGSVQGKQNFSNGKPIGEHRTYFPKSNHVQSDEAQSDQERLAHVLRYDNEGKLHGEEKTFFENGKPQAVLAYEHGVLNGHKFMWDSKGKLIEEATYLLGKLEGKFFQVASDGREIVTYYHNNLKNGPHCIFYPPNEKGEKIKALETAFENDQIEGLVVEFDPQGVKLAETPYAKGHKNGLARIYSPEGKLSATIEFCNDKKQGITTQFFPSGAVFRETDYKQDLRDGEEKTYFDNGRIASIFIYQDDQLNGLCQSWNQEGILLFAAEYSHGLRHGKFNKYYEDGKPYIQQAFVFDKPDGKKVKYGTDGKMTVSNYRSGELVDSPTR